MASGYFQAPAYYRPMPDDAPAVFLAGGISGCPPWREHAIELLGGADVAVLDPARADFPFDDPDARWEQVCWEQHHLRLPGVITLFWFPDSGAVVQPIALFELGQALGEHRDPVVGVDPGYVRADDVRMLCRINAPRLTVHEDMDSLLAEVLTRVETAR
ncbi:nucleoside 2-deoxyribosyltransferase domain-containing protein [Actinocorallia sp. B10E7]|uniref:nucleoside 2-deoxyribosyltransferase domain-containing protein n=1 Tax=Actinocorallia sp. B10E7 TaxID=3153558 RepID=UPI00325E5BFA